MRVYDNNKIKTYRSLFELANSNVLVGRKDGLIIGIDENTIQELRDTIDNNNYLHSENERLNNIIKEAKKIFEDNYYKENTTDINEVIFFGKKDDVSGLMYEKLKAGKGNE